jgi:hypothetical protein
MNENSIESSRVIRVSGIEVTQIKSGVWQWTEAHGALVTATLKPSGWTKASRDRKVCTCTDEELQPILDAIAAAQSNGLPISGPHTEGEKPEARYGKAENPKEESRREEPMAERKQQQSSTHSSDGNGSGAAQWAEENRAIEVLGAWHDRIEAMAFELLRADAEYHKPHLTVDLILEPLTEEIAAAITSSLWNVKYAVYKPPEGLTKLEVREEIDPAIRRAWERFRKNARNDLIVNGSLDYALPAKTPEPLIVAPDRPLLLTFADSRRLAEEAESRPHVIQDLITAQDIFGVAGKKGFGKSTFLRWMAVAVSEGWDFLGLKTNQTRVWYIDLEPGNHQKRHEKFERLGWNERSQNLIVTASPPVAGQPWAFEWLEEEIEKNGFGLVIIDTLFKFCKIESGNDYSSGLYGSAPLEGVVKRTKAAIGVAHHSQKNGNPNNPNVSAADLFLGAVSIAGSFGVCLAIRRTRGGPEGSRTSLFMDPPRYTRQVIEGEWLIAEDPMTGRVELGESLKRDWWRRAQEDVMGMARRLNRPFTVTNLLERLDGYKRVELKRVLGYLVEDRKLNDLGKENKRGGAVQYELHKVENP